MATGKGLDVMTDTEWDLRWAALQRAYDNPDAPAKELGRKPRKPISVLGIALFKTLLVGVVTSGGTWAFVQMMEWLTR